MSRSLAITFSSNAYYQSLDVPVRVPSYAKPEPARGFSDFRDFRDAAQLSLVLWLVPCAGVWIFNGGLTLVDWRQGGSADVKLAEVVVIDVYRVPGVPVTRGQDLTCL